MAILELSGEGTEQAISDITKNVQKLGSIMEELDNKFNTLIPDEIDFEWANEAKANWKNFYNDKIPEYMDSMLLSAENLKKAAEEVARYSKNK